MRKYHKSLCICAAVITLTMLAGCDGQSNRSNDSLDGAIGDASKSISEAIGNVVGDAGKGLHNMTLDIAKDLKTEGISKKFTVTEEVKDKDKLKIDHVVGNIELKAASGNQMIVDVVIYASNASIHKKKVEKILDQAEVSVNVSGDKVQITAYSKDNPKQTLWDFAESKYGFSEFVIDYVVQIPDTIKSYDISNHVGDINLQNIQGTFLVHNDVGIITIGDAHITGKSSLDTAMGSIELGIAQMDRDSSLKAKTEVGSINVTLAKSLECNVTAKSELGSISGVSKGTSTINGGGPEVSLSSSVGSITVN